MNQSQILKAFVNRISSLDLMTLSLAAAESENASKSASVGAQVQARHTMLQSIEAILDKLSDDDRQQISNTILKEAGGPEGRFQHFKSTRQLYNLHELVDQGNEAAATFMETNNAPSSTEVYGYNDADGIPSLFIALTDNHQVALIIANTCDETHVRNVDRLERQLFDWACGEGYFD